MSDVVLLDTSVYLNVLDVEGWNQDRNEILRRFGDMIKSGAYFLLPMASIWETGNHIADLSDGRQRRRYAAILVEQVTKALQGDVPYKPTTFPSRDLFLEWLRAFPDYAMRNKSATKTREGVSLSDLSIIKEWEATRDRHTLARVFIWSLDSDLSGYDTGVRS